MHMNGQRLISQIRRKGSAEWVTFHDTQWFQHLMQRAHPLDLKVYPGDELRSECIFTNDKPGEVLHIGTNTFNEMCMQVAQYYPKQFKDNSNMWIVGYMRGTAKDPNALRGHTDGASELWCGDVNDMMKYDAEARKQSRGEPLLKWNHRAKARLPVDFSIMAKEGWGIVE
jgi:hypothetical protein